MLNVNFYRNKSEVIKVDKELTHVIDESIVFLDNVDMLRPSVILSKKINTNYAYISDFGRYYYVTITALTGGQFQYDFVCDVLMTYKNDIKNVSCTVVKTENKKLTNAYLHDDGYMTLAFKKYVTKQFAKGFSQDTMILNVIN